MKPASQPIDFDHLDAYTAGDTELIREVLRLFRGQVAQLITTLNSTGDKKTWRETAHGIKGAARGIGAWAIAEAAAASEQIDMGDATARADVLSRLRHAAEAVYAVIDAELAKPS